jgi:nitroreductase/NAD-dependent dihydropyrimidine dehydrogenase PreA subunit
MAWDDVKPILRPEGVHMGVMKADADKCTQCGLCMENCPFGAWEAGDDGLPRMRDEYECFSCYNCMAACQEDAIVIVDVYHVDPGHYWATDPRPLGARMPLEPKDAEGKPDKWNEIERAVMERRSVRHFEDRPVPEHFIRRVLEAGRFAPSAGNCQPWKFIVITDKAILAEIDKGIVDTMKMFDNMYKSDDMVKGLEAMCQPPAGPGVFDPRQILGGTPAIVKAELPPSLNAPAMILLLGDERAIGGPQINIGICGQNMNLVANSLGIKACWVGFVAVIENLPQLKEKLGITPPWRIVSSLVLGYPSFPQEGVVPREYRPVTWFREGSDGPEIEE